MVFHIYRNSKYIHFVAIMRHFSQSKITRAWGCTKRLRTLGQFHRFNLSQLSPIVRFKPQNTPKSVSEIAP